MAKKNILTFLSYFIVKDRTGKEIGLLRSTFFEIFGIVTLLLIFKKFKIHIEINNKNLQKFFTLCWPYLIILSFNFLNPKFWYIFLKELHPNTAILVVFYSLFSALLVGIFEELLVRGGVFPVASSYFKNNAAIKGIFISAFAFSLMHTMNFMNGVFWDTVNQLIYTIGYGVFFATLYYVTGNLIIPITLHTLIDTFGFINNMSSLLHNTSIQHQLNPTLIVITALIILFSLYILKRYKNEEKRLDKEIELLRI